MSGKALPVAGSGDTAPEQAAFAEVLELIQAARGRAFQAVNSELVGLY
jgi:hypothetical protein